MVMMGALTELSSFSADEIGAMTADEMQFWLNCISLYREEIKQKD